MFKTRLTTRVIGSQGTRRLGLTRNNTAKVVVNRLEAHLAEVVPDWNPKVTRGRGKITIELEIPAQSEAHAKEKMLYWARRVVTSANLVFREEEIIEFSAVKI